MADVSVIIPVYNYAEFIESAIVSVLEQTEPVREILVVNDGSTDESPEIIASLASRDSRLKVITQTNSGKPSIARNAALGHATGEFVCFLDGDDIYHPDKVARCVAILQDNPGISAVFHDVKLIAEDGREMPGSYLQDLDFLPRASSYVCGIHNTVYILNESFYRFMSLNYAAFHTSSAFVRRSLLETEKIFFPEDVTIGEDTEFWFRIAIGGKVAYIDEILSYYRRHGGNITSNREKFLKDVTIIHIRNFTKNKGLFSNAESKKYKKKIALHYSYLAFDYYRAFRMREARRAYLSSLRWNLNTENILGYSKTFIPIPATRVLHNAISRFR